MADAVDEHDQVAEPAIALQDRTSDEQLESGAEIRVRKLSAKRPSKRDDERREIDDRGAKTLRVASDVATAADRVPSSQPKSVSILSRITISAQNTEDAFYILGLAHLEIAVGQDGDSRVEIAKMAAEQLGKALDRPDVVEKQQAIYGLFAAKLLSGDRTGAAQVLAENPIDFDLLGVDQVLKVKSFLESGQPRLNPGQPVQISPPRTHARGIAS